MKDIGAYFLNKIQKLQTITGKIYNWTENIKFKVFFFLSGDHKVVKIQATNVQRYISTLKSSYS